MMGAQVNMHARGGVGMGVLGTGPIPDLLISTPEGKAHREKLELVASFSFFGNVMSMASVQLAGAKRDALLLSFKDAKVSSVSLAGGPGHSGVGWDVLVRSRVVLSGPCF